MLIITEDATLVCKHELGKIAIKASQDLVRVDGRRVLVENDPEGRPISHCPNYGVTIKPCLNTLAVKAGYSDLLHAEGKRICLDSVFGLTDGTPPGTVEYKVRAAGQDFVSSLV